jgi:hypothetical protein
MVLFSQNKTIAKELHWHLANNDIAFGYYKEYFFTLGNGQNIKYIAVYTGVIDQINKDLIKTELENKRLKYILNKLIIDNNHLVLHLKCSGSISKKVLYEYFDYLVEILTKYQINKSINCQKCHSIDVFDYYEISGLGYILCKSCYQTALKEISEIKVKLDTEDKNYFIGFAGSLAFSLAGIIVWVLVSVYLGVLTSALALLIVALSIYGYKYYGGRIGKYSSTIIVLTSILCILMANCLSLFFTLLKHGYNYQNAILLITSNQKIQDALKTDITLSFILSVAVLVWVFISFKLQYPTIQLAKKL